MAKVRSNIRSNKAAGRELQNWTCKQFSGALETPWGTADDLEIRPRPGGQGGVDIIFSVRLKALLSRLGIPHSVECKNHKTWNVQKAIIQARNNSSTGKDWALIMKRRSQQKAEKIEPVIVMDASVFFELLGSLHGKSKN